LAALKATPPTAEALARLVDGFAAEAAVATGCTSLPERTDDPDRRPPHARRWDHFVLTFSREGAAVPTAHVGPVTVFVTVGERRRDVTVTAVDEDSYRFSLRELLEEADHGEAGMLVLQYTDGRKDIYYFRVEERFEWYRFASSPVPGLWIPLGLFATNLRPAPGGIPLAVLPIGAAFGFKLFPANGRGYVGLSGMVNLSLSEGIREPETTGESILLAGLSIGAMVDCSGYLYVGYAYGVSFAEGVDSPGHMLVVGLGPGLLEFLKSD
jgi:hypothetical protein